MAGARHLTLGRTGPERAQSDLDEAGEIAEASRLIEKHGCLRRMGELEAAEAALGLGCERPGSSLRLCRR